MMPEDLVLYDEEFQKIRQALQRLFQDTSALLVLLVDKTGQQIAAAGTMKSLDTTALATLTAGTVAATDGLARLIGEKEFSILFHEGEKHSLHISIVSRQVILVVLFDERSSLGLVRLRVRLATGELAALFEEIANKIDREKTTLAAEVDTPTAEITDDDIDRLFSE